MAKVVLAWELGAGMAHLVPFRIIGERLAADGHEVVAIVRDLQAAAAVFAGTSIRVLQAPFKQRLAGGAMREIVCFADILLNIGFGDAGELAYLADAWRHLLRLLAPDLILFDHSPTALLASRGLGCRTAFIGVGFSNPPANRPLPVLRPWKNADPNRLADSERQCVSAANRVLERWGLIPISEVLDLYKEVAGLFLSTIEALDPFAPRSGAAYLGALALPGAPAPSWPAVLGRRVFAYLKPFPALPTLLADLQQRKLPTLIVAPDLPNATVLQFSSPTLHFTKSLVDLRAAAADCELAILNASNAATAAMLLAGKPMLHVPLVLEQVFTARAIERLGAGLGAEPSQPAAITDALNRLLTDDTFANRAQAASAEANASLQPLEANLNRIAALAR